MEFAEALQQFRTIQARIHAYNHASGILYYDGVTTAPSGSGEGRAQTMGVLSGDIYDLQTGEKTLEVLAVLRAHRAQLDARAARELELFSRGLEYAASIPKDEYVDYQMHINRSEDIWQTAREKSDFAMFAPYLEKTVRTLKKFAKYYKPGEPAYNTMLDMYEHGLTMETADRFFDLLRQRLVPLMRRVAAAQQIDASFLHKSYPVHKQRRFSDLLMDMLTIDRAYCGIGETAHPFTTEFNKHDVRITTHYDENDLASSMYSVIHEGGHALYELHGGGEYENTCVAGGVSMGIHESQSRFFENIIGRSEAFCRCLFPKVQALFPEQLAGVDAGMFYRAVNRSEASLIRTEADELTYPMHILVRYELEKALVEGDLTVAQLPQAWDAKMREYLGVEVPDDAHGVLQDVHWAGGMLGYFPSYALGSAYSAQMLAAMERDIDVEAAVEQGRLAPVVSWLSERIYRHSSMYDPNVLLPMCCGAEFDPEYYIAYLEKKYTGLYGL